MSFKFNDFKSLNLCPVFSNTCFHNKRDGQGYNGLHCIYNEGFRFFYIFLANLKNQFIVNLKKHISFKPSLFKKTMKFDHSFFNNICISSLKRRINGLSFTKTSATWIPAMNVRNKTPAS